MQRSKSTSRLSVALAAFINPNLIQAQKCYSPCSADTMTFFSLFKFIFVVIFLSVFSPVPTKAESKGKEPVASDYMRAHLDLYKVESFRDEKGQKPGDVRVGWLTRSRNEIWISQNISPTTRNVMAIKLPHDINKKIPWNDQFLAPLVEIKKTEAGDFVATYDIPRFHGDTGGYYTRLKATIVLDSNKRLKSVQAEKYSSDHVFLIFGPYKPFKLIKTFKWKR